MWSKSMLFLHHLTEVQAHFFSFREWSSDPIAQSSSLSMQDWLQGYGQSTRWDTARSKYQSPTALPILCKQIWKYIIDKLSCDRGFAHFSLNLPWFKIVWNWIVLNCWANFKTARRTIFWIEGEPSAFHESWAPDWQWAKHESMNMPILGDCSGLGSADRNSSLKSVPKITSNRGKQHDQTSQMNIKVGSSRKTIGRWKDH